MDNDIQLTDDKVLAIADMLGQYEIDIANVVTREDAAFQRRRNADLQTDLLHSLPGMVEDRAQRFELNWHAAVLYLETSAILGGMWDGEDEKALTGVHRSNDGSTTYSTKDYGFKSSADATRCTRGGRLSREDRYVYYDDCRMKLEIPSLRGLEQIEQSMFQEEDLVIDADGDYKIIHGDGIEYLAQCLPGSIDWIITDPPYPKEYLGLYGELAEQSIHALKPGGSLLVMCGQSYLPEIMNMMTHHITYRWTLTYLTPGGQAAQIWQRNVNTFWKPVLWFLKGEYAGDWIGDVTKSNVNDNDKSLHKWGQSVSGMVDLVGRFVKPGDLVVDPFCGAGTTGVAALHHGCDFVGIDNDEEQIIITKERLNAIG